jgi:acyl dehydratase
VVAWGDNSYGQTTVPEGLTQVVAIAAGVHHSLALKVDGTVVAWLGVDAVRAHAPVRFGDTIRVVARVAELRPASRGDRDVCVLEYEVVNQAGTIVRLLTEEDDEDPVTRAARE